jgi:hypothetical protein
MPVRMTVGLVPLVSKPGMRVDDPGPMTRWSMACRQSSSSPQERWDSSLLIEGSFMSVERGQL